jgi:hypothetical protein
MYQGISAIVAIFGGAEFDDSALTPPHTFEVSQRRIALGWDSRVVSQLVAEAPRRTDF